MRREDLLEQIFRVLHAWPELDRRIFIQAHYQGQSAESIARTLQMNLDAVNSILKQCDRRLHASLRTHCTSGERPSAVESASSSPTVSGLSMKTPMAPVFKAGNLLNLCKIPA